VPVVGLRSPPPPWFARHWQRAIRRWRPARC